MSEAGPSRGWLGPGPAVQPAGLGCAPAANRGVLGAGGVSGAEARPAERPRVALPTGGWRGGGREKARRERVAGAGARAGVAGGDWQGPGAEVGLPSVLPEEAAQAGRVFLV